MNKEKKEGKTEIEFMPNSNYVVIDPGYKKETKSGVIIPESAKEQTKDIFARVVATGKDVEDYKIGDRVTVVGYATPTGIIVNDVTYLVFKETEVLGKSLQTEIKV